MKTFKMKKLEIVANKEDNIEQRHIPLHDGLVINREDEVGWLIEAYIEQEYAAYFQQLEPIEELMIQVKITREENDPAFFITKIIAMNEIGDNMMNVIFQGNIVDHGKGRIEEMLRTILEQGYQGESLIRKFKEMI